MFIETSAVVAILAGEAEAAVFLDLIDGAERRETGAHVRLETTINLASILDAQDLYDGFIRAARITIVPVDDEVACRAVEAFAVYGKGQGHPARLNVADCLSYACAHRSRLPILFKGRDFSQTDLALAVSG
ncbi:type II toxin-antitoxin system VapC family toxin [Methylobacterium sp. SyP6R]|uniref:type II toxin-antitoxin system VapC family toxin n=1 Tax=Methylobacterium sp. SyP6R TaxID=2718876 RepID=UPI001F453C7E|nr:type II toxin-antitoxin system VapC family toxin [Methylobacterium sp. SyP6R]MCF4127240.1 type II toxin-antitoxin system VapC family toxin [Methylobacterium sp. SyP6R]